MAKRKPPAASRRGSRTRPPAARRTLAIKNVNVPNTRTRINKEKYDLIRQALLAVVPRSREGVLFRDLPGLVESYLERISKDWQGSINWYVTTVKLDLEARNLLARLKGSSPQRIRRVGSHRQRGKLQPRKSCDFRMVF